MDHLAHLMRHQCGVISRTQLLAAGREAHEIRRLVRRRELTPIARGVYADHTGPLTWTQRAWRAVLAVPDSALSHASAIRAVTGADGSDADDRWVHVAVGRTRSMVAPTGVRIHHVADFGGKVLSSASPPRFRIEEAILDVAAESTDPLRAIGRLADAVQARLTTPDRLLLALSRRTRIPRRSLLEAALRDIALGTGSALEHRYLLRVERPHGLPPPDRQKKVDTTDGTTYRDLDYPDFGLVIELDGRQFHDSAHHRDRDLDRDLDSALAGRRTVRLGWGQVVGRPCDTAHKIAALLTAGGWTGRLARCPACDQTMPTSAVRTP